jgi:hypothetical protein
MTELKELINNFREYLHWNVFPDILTERVNAVLKWVADIEKAAQKELDTLSPSLPWLNVEQNKPEQYQDVIFIVESDNDFYNGRILGGRYQGNQYGYHDFSVPGHEFSAKLWQPSPKKPGQSTKTEAIDETLMDMINWFNDLPSDKKRYLVSKHISPEKNASTLTVSQVQKIYEGKQGNPQKTEAEPKGYRLDCFNNGCKLDCPECPQKTEAKTSCNSYQHIEVENFIKKTITETAAAMLVWIKEDTIIRDRHGAIIPYAEIDVREHPKSLISRVYKNLEKHGLKLLNNEQNVQVSDTTKADSNFGPDNQK